LSVSNLTALQQRHEQQITMLSVSRSSIQAQLDEPEHAPGGHLRLQAKLAQNEAATAANHRQLAQVRASLVIALDGQIEVRSASLSRAESRRDVALISVRDAGGSKAHRKHLSDVLMAADASLETERELLKQTQAELAAAEAE